ncbi:unnamed protein product [Caenorhabditis bovis]|uniref:Uncharacterized protein n=1 Tax=Caenorhabditis bovis TaxID=2654633 RepID=A0A8S1F5C6_9PELO|nr:unnamed protein product [Caenorhabditis bovis]
MLLFRSNDAAKLRKSLPKLLAKIFVKYAPEKTSNKKFRQNLKTLLKRCAKIGVASFFTEFWRIANELPESRLGAMTYLICMVEHLESRVSINGDDDEAMVEAFCKMASIDADEALKHCLLKLLAKINDRCTAVKPREWIIQMSTGNCQDLLLRANLLEFLLNVRRCSLRAKNSYLEEDLFILPRCFPTFVDPILSSADTQFIEKLEFYELCANALWMCLTSKTYSSYHYKWAVQLHRIHLLDHSDGPSFVEKFIVDHLMSDDKKIVARAHETFDTYFQSLNSRTNVIRPLNSVYMLLPEMSPNSSL